MKKHLILLFCIITFYTKAQQTISDWKYQKDFSSNPSNFVQAGKKTYFLATNPEQGRELWVTEGTTESTKLVKDIMVGENSAFIEPYTTFRNIVALDNGTMYFIASDNPNDNPKIWVTDGTEAGTKIYKNEVKGTLFYTGDELVEYVFDTKEGKFNIYHQDSKKDVSLTLGLKSSVNLSGFVRYINNNLLTISARASSDYDEKKPLYIAIFDLKAQILKVESSIPKLQGIGYQDIIAWKGEIYLSTYAYSPNMDAMQIVTRMNVNTSKLDTLFNEKIQVYDDDAFSKLITSKNELLLNFNDQIYSLQNNKFIKKDDPKSYKIAFINTNYFHPYYDSKNNIRYNFINDYDKKQMTVRAISLSDGSLKEYTIPNVYYALNVSSNLIKIVDINYKPKGFFDLVKDQPRELTHEFNEFIQVDGKLIFGGYNKKDKIDNELYILDNQSFDVKLLKNINVNGLQRSRIETTMFNGKLVQVYVGDKGIMLGVSDGTKAGTKDVKMLIKNTDITILTNVSFKEVNQRLGILITTQNALDINKDSVFCFSIDKKIEVIKLLFSDECNRIYLGTNGYAGGYFTDIPNNANITGINPYSKHSTNGYISDFTVEGTKGFGKSAYSDVQVLSANDKSLLAYVYEGSLGLNKNNEARFYILKYDLKTFKSDTIPNTKDCYFPIVFNDRLYYNFINDQKWYVSDGVTSKSILGVKPYNSSYFFKANNTTFIMQSDKNKLSIFKVENLEVKEIWSETAKQGEFRIASENFVKPLVVNGKTYLAISIPPVYIGQTYAQTIKAQVVFYEVKADNTLQKVYQIEDTNDSQNNFVFRSMRLLSKGLSYYKKIDSKLVFYVIQDDFIPKEVYSSIENDSFEQYDDRESKKKQFFFLASGSLFVSDGSIEGSQLLVKNNLVTPEFISSNPIIHPIDSLGNRFYFTLWNYRDKALYGTNLWITDGTKAGTVELLNQKYMPKPYPYESSNGDRKEFLGVLGNKFFFQKNNDVNGMAEIWVSEGTVATTRKIVEPDKKPVGQFYANSTYSYYGYNLFYPYSAHNFKLSKIKDKLYFTKQNLDLGYEPWQTDGTPEGTKMVGDLIKGAQSSNPYQFFEINQKPYVIATEENKALQLWSFCQPKASFIADKIIPNGIEEVKLVATQNIEYKYQWLKNGKDIDKANLTNYTANTSGTYQLKVEDLIGCINISDSLVINFSQKILANEPLTDSFKLKIYPNPTLSDLNIIFESNEKDNFEATLYDVTGKIMIQKTVSSNTVNSISTQQLNAGMYFLRLTNGEEQTIQKVIKN